MYRSSLLKRKSSISIRIDQERGSHHQNAVPQEIKAAVNNQNENEERVAAMPRPYPEEENVGAVQGAVAEKQDGDTSDTDVISSSDEDTAEMEKIDPSAKPGEIFPFNSTFDEYWKHGEINVEEDARKERESVNDTPMKDPAPPVDASFEDMTENGVVCFDDENDIFFDVLLTKVNALWRRKGLNEFLKLQVVNHKGKQLWIVFSHWGPIGGRRRHKQQTPFNNPQDAYSKFKKIFQSKTGNKWGDLETFQKMPGKYALVKNEKNPERMHHCKEKILQSFNEDECLKSNLPEELKKFVHSITNLDIFTQRLSKNENLDQKLMPFGHISWDAVQAAKDLLQEVKDKWKLRKEGLKHLDLPETNADKAKFYEEIAELSNEFFMMIPQYEYSFEKIKPLNEMTIVNDYLRKVEELRQLYVASELLLAAQHNKAEINPLDYCYRGLGIHCELMDPSSEESQYILEYLESSYYSDKPPMIAGIYRINRPAEKNNFEECGIKDNRQMLWHGTHAAHMISVLKHGLKMDAKNGSLINCNFGNGVYFSMKFNVALRDDTSSPRFVFLCEVALGHMKQETRVKYRNDRWSSHSPIQSEDEEESARGYNTRWLVGYEIPDPDCDITMPFGAKLRRGKWICDPVDPDWRRPRTHFCVVRDPKQIKIRYLVQTKSK